MRGPGLEGFSEGECLHVSLSQRIEPLIQRDAEAVAGYHLVVLKMRAFGFWTRLT